MKNVYRYIFVFVTGIIITSTTRCRNPDYATPELTTFDVSQDTASSAISGGNVYSNGGSAIKSRGVCWSVDPEPTRNNGKTQDGSGPGHFLSNITGLSPLRTYYLGAYATNSEGTAYGTEVSPTTPPPDTVATDLDGNVYHFITIGTQIWMV